MAYTTDELNQTGIYVIINRDTGKRYIGSTAESFRKRWNRHKSDLRGNRYDNPYLQKAWNKYTEFRFEFKILEVVPKEEWTDKRYLLDIEQMYLDTYQPEYNICKSAGNTLGRLHTEESKKKCGQANLGNKYWVGKNHSEESKQKISKSREGKYKAENNHFYGKKHSDESKEKVAKANSKNYKIYSPDGQEFIINNMAAFCREYNLNNGNLSSVASGKVKQCKGWRAEYL
ncbi:GIY-YIG nuclease family protein [Nostoc sp. KVJ3]|uniref:NUMOD3 domain-containing DNA-binding protein n=1 Tax=Nostoc sp. KVJ3 TaxID=457945 RepID=UPI002237D7FC|nr:NUMOD3 domain-containing DNA-binding protein [Nostoc sp. KVJ3]MCW5317950.1 GIY-YIG nuclease family protein [Nostoc sp. KVJ3]